MRSWRRLQRSRLCSRRRRVVLNPSATVPPSRLYFICLAGFLVKFWVQDVLKLTVQELDILRTAEELSTLNSQIRLKFPFSVPGFRVLPETFPIDSLSTYTNVSMTTDTLRTSQLFEDFATIDFKDCFEVKWLIDMTTLPTMFQVRLHAFWSVPPKLPRVPRVPITW